MQNILIVVEGPDGSGKTTLINRIMQEIPGLGYQKPVPSKGPEGQTADYMIRWMEEAFWRVKTGSNYIMDRTNLVSEQIYGPICRGRSLFENGQHMAVQKEFFALNPIIIFCWPPLGAVVENLDNDPGIQMVGVRENLTKIYEAYVNFFDNWMESGIRVYLYDYTKELDRKLIVDNIKAEIERRSKTTETTFEITLQVTATITPEQVNQKSEDIINQIANWDDDVRRVQLVEPPIIEND